MLRNHRYGMFFVSVVLLNSVVFCHNATYKYYPKIAGNTPNVFTTRQQRLIGFNTDGDLKIDLDFNVPFITLPVRKSMEMAKTSLINLNVGAVVLAGTVIFGAAIALPIVLGFLNKKSLIPDRNPVNSIYANIPNQRSEDSHLWKYLAELDNSLLENGIDFTSCSLRLVCWAVKHSSQNVAKGRGSSMEKIFDGMVSSKWFQENILNSAFIEAVNIGLKGEECSSLYGKCKIDNKIVFQYSKYFLNIFNRS